MAIVSNLTTGPYLSGANWAAGIIPARTDQVIITDGTVLTLSGGTAELGDIGTITATDYAIRTNGDNGTGVLVIEPSGTLICYAHVRIGNVNWRCDGALLTGNAATRLNLQNGTRSAGPYGQLSMTGLGPGQRARIGKTSGAVGWNALGGPTQYTGRGRIIASWAWFDSCGPTNGFFNDMGHVAGRDSSFTDCVWTNCVEIDYRNLANNIGFVIERRISSSCFPRLLISLSVSDAAIYSF